jgi:hypothetical protein
LPPPGESRSRSGSRDTPGVTNGWKPHKKYRHVFAVIRLDDVHSPDAPLEDRFYLKKVMLTEEAAEHEVARLNALNSDKNCRYVVHIAQLDER